MIYLHDGSFDGFLTCIFKHYYEEKADEIYSEASYLPQLFQEARIVITDKDKAERVNQAILDKITQEGYENIFYTFYSNNYYKDCYFLEYIQAGFKLGQDISNLHSHPSAFNVNRLKRKVAFERHRFLGLLRFSDIHHCLYASFEPDNDIVELLADHFADRLKNERFIIHDVKRKKAVISHFGDWLLTDFDYEPSIVRAGQEDVYVELWRNYFNTVSIDGRKNLKLQRGFVPMKYRLHLSEFQKSM